MISISAPTNQEAEAGIPDYIQGSINSITEEYEKLINAEKSIVNELFYGMVTTTMEYLDCRYKKLKNGPIMCLPLSIPNKISYHSSYALILIDNSLPNKALVPLNFNNQEAVD